MSYSEMLMKNIKVCCPWLNYYPFKRQSHKMVKHTQTIRRNFPLLHPQKHWNIGWKWVNEESWWEADEI